MQKKLNLRFCKNIITTDFFLVKENILHNSYKFEKCLKGKKQTLSSLNILNLYKELKQFIRLLEYVSRKEKNQLVIHLKDPQYAYLLKKYISSYNVSNIFLANRIGNERQIHSKGLKRIIPSKRRRISTPISKMFLSLNNNSGKNFERILSYHKYMLIAKICFENKALKGSHLYHIYNKLDSYKKYCFLLAILEKIFCK